MDDNKVLYTLLSRLNLYFCPVCKYRGDECREQCCFSVKPNGKKYAQQGFEVFMQLLDYEVDVDEAFKFTVESADEKATINIATLIDIMREANHLEDVEDAQNTEV